MDELSLVQRLAVVALPLIFAITVHEAAHGYVAWLRGDDTARRLGRITINPLPHIDPIGTVLVPVAMVLFFGFAIGWAKPVPVDVMRLKSPRRDSALVAVAGPGANLLMALLWSLVMLASQHFLHSAHTVAYPLLLMAGAGVFINLMLMTLNLLPVPPLDGGRILVGLLPLPVARVVASLEPYGMFILIGLLATGLLGAILWPIIQVALLFMPGSELLPVILPVLFS
jgi:Zn-dependent protease